ncbi:unnamed protein product [Absidia cylindrospora]
MSKPLLASQTAQQIGELLAPLATPTTMKESSLLHLFLKSPNVGITIKVFLGQLHAHHVGAVHYAVITNWWLLFTVAFIIGGFYLVSRTTGPGLTVGGMTVPSSTLYATYAGGSFVLLLFSGATGAVFWVLGAGALVILGHAAIIEPSIEGDFADEQV